MGENMSELDIDTEFPYKVNLIAEELGVEDQINFAGVFEADDTKSEEEVVGFYSPQDGVVGINEKYAGTYRENSTAVHEAIHPLQYDKMIDKELDEEEKGIYKALMEGQASKYTPMESSYPDLEMLYDSFMETSDPNCMKNYKEVYEVLKECEKVLENSDLEGTMKQGFGDPGEKYEKFVETYDLGPGNETY